MPEAEYGSYNVSIHYEWDEGIIAEPLASDEDLPPELIKLSSGFGKKWVVWEVTATGAKPKVPSAEPNDGEVLLRTKVTPNIPLPVNEEGTAEFYCSGVYEYQLTKDPAKGVGYTTGLPPLYKGQMRVVWGAPDFVKGIH